MYAITENSWRAIEEGQQLLVGESLAATIPETLIKRVESDEMKSQRNQRLRDTDWTQMADAPLTAAQKTAMSVYRQALRDLPSLPGFPDIAWPALPQLSGAAGDIKAPM